MARKNNTVPLLDAGRGIAALSVLAYHAGVHFLFPEPFGRILNVGANGVTVFFVISGFLLARPFIQARLDGAAMPDVKTYALRRFLRIVPAYWVALTLAIVIGGKETPGGAITYYGFAQIYSESTVLGGLGPAWTLCVEALYYVMLPLLAMVLMLVPASSVVARRRREIAAVALLFAIGVGIKLYYALSHPGGFYALPLGRQQVLQFSLPWALDAFAVGMFFALMREGVIGVRAAAAIGRHPAFCWAASGAAFAVLAGQFHVGSGSVLWSRAWQLLLAAGLLAPMLFGEVSAGRIRRLLAHRALLWAGVISYSVYLYNQSVMTKLADHMPNRVPADLRPWVGLLVGLVATLAIAAVSHRLIEAPAQRLGHRRRSTPVADQPAEAGGVP